MVKKSTDMEKREIIKATLFTIILFITSLFQMSAHEKGDEMRGSQWGAEVRGDIYDLAHSITWGNVSLGYRFNRNSYLGARVGLGKGKTYIDATPANYNFIGFPLLVDYTYYFGIGKAKRHSLYLGGEIGSIFQLYQDEFEEEDKEWMKKSSGLAYAGLKFGFDFDIGKQHLFFGLKANYLGVGWSLGMTF